MNDATMVSPLVCDGRNDLAVAREDFCTYVEARGDAIIGVDAEGGIVLFGPGAERVFGLSASEAMHRPWTLLFPEASPGPPCRSGEALCGKAIRAVGCRRDGTRFPADLWWCRWGTDCAAVVRDVGVRPPVESEQDRIAAQLLQGQKLQAIGQLSAGIAHEINNPVSYILANVTALGEYFADLTRLVHALSAACERLTSGEDPGRIRADLELLRKQIDADFILRDCQNAVRESREGAERIREIVKNLKEFAHPDEGERKPADLNECLESTIRVCWNELKYKATMHRDYGTLPAVKCYPQRIKQAFMNLLVNAAQAIPGKGDIFVATRREGADAVVRIRDTGCGIPPENLRRLFEPFFTTKPVGKGTGLGLHLTYTVVKAHGGEIDVQSAAGKGTEFVVRLPIGAP